MRYQCKNCKAEFNFPGDSGRCPICEHHGYFLPIPDFEPPEQYEKRTGKTLSDIGLVWVKDGAADEEGWRSDLYKNALDNQREYIVCVSVVFARLCKHS